ncbi:adenylate/guanylate cyclase domain-containing protein [Streptomyces violascens]|uniref:adenylate/guanylate cyclase domain-containing protein n=1 Tax=Streptomyces violascens TaxID=67381 RepID=UPI0016751251|nr:adenylate/guanylate cyclase domain-containing protein [Streptomyces violascens]
MTEFAKRTPGADAAAEVKRFHALWDAAAEADSPPQTTDEPGLAQEVSLRVTDTATVFHVPATRVEGPTPRSLLLADLEMFSRRDDIEQAYLRRMLFGLLDRVAEAADVAPAARRQEDRGDGVMELIDAGVPMPDLLRAVLTVIPATLRQVNRLASGSVQLRPRLVLSTGNVTVDEHGCWVGSALNDACRLLDAEAVRAALHEGEDAHALCVSNAVYQSTVRHNFPGISAEEFREIAVPAKGGVLQAWLHHPLSA